MQVPGPLETFSDHQKLLILVDFPFLIFAAALSGWRDANVKNNPLDRIADRPAGQGYRCSSRA
jgi:hypothetical protein